MNIEKLRKDFPILKDGKIIYFDNACMSLKPVQVVRAMERYYYEFPGCAGRSMHKIGKRTEEEYAKSREKAAKFINAKHGEIVFTKNTTESINLVSHSIKLGKNDTVLTTDKEHNSNLIPWQRCGARHEVIVTNEDGTFSMENLKKILNKSVKLVSVVHTSNIDGVTNPAKEISKMAHDAGAKVLLDCAQSAPHKEIDVKRIGADFIAFSGHKMLGPSIGVLYGRRDLLEGMEPFMTGGDTVSRTTYRSAEFLKPPEKFEAGLQNYAGAIGHAAAMDYLNGIGMKNIERHETGLNECATKSLSEIEGVGILGPRASERSGILSFNIEDIDFHQIALMASEMGIMLRSGQHCVHSWFASRGIAGSVRASFYLYNTRDEVDKFVDALKKIAALR
ncbi:MAG: cysteine desulfurase [Candidatus Aenigmarchaeota archaeon]|nr:cysteine desulfurase [Candidatus Aenigmarchaeota archaeon]